MAVIIEKTALYSESDYIITLTLASWLCSFLGSPVHRIVKGNILAATALLRFAL